MPLPSWVLGRDPPRETEGPKGYSNQKCPRCGTRLAYGYQGATSIVDRNVLICEKQGCGYVSQGEKSEPKESPKIVATFSSPAQTVPVVPKSETSWFKALSPWRKSEILAEETRGQSTAEIAKSRGLVVTKYKGKKGDHYIYAGRCPRCQIHTTSLGLKCRRCKTDLEAPLD
jgi:hypothetical protein